MHRGTATIARRLGEREKRRANKRTSMRCAPSQSTCGTVSAATRQQVPFYRSMQFVGKPSPPTPRVKTYGFYLSECWLHTDSIKLILIFDRRTKGRANACRFATIVFEAPAGMPPMCRKTQYAFLNQNRGFKIYMRLPWNERPLVG